jgi:hypothetical protein
MAIGSDIVAKAMKHEGVIDFSTRGHSAARLCCYACCYPKSAATQGI